jgi:hypothetical protein
MAGGLLDLDVPALTQRLIEAVRLARRLAVEGSDLELHDMLAEVRAATEEASGTKYELLQLAEAALRTAARTDLGRAELAMREFLAKHPKDADEIFSALLEPSRLAAPRVDRLDAEARKRFENLVRVGVLVRSADGYELRAPHRALARELHEPTVLRMWRLVDQCKTQIAASRLDHDGGAAYLAAHLGIAEPQASRFLAREQISISAQRAMATTAIDRFIYVARELVDNRSPASSSDTAPPSTLARLRNEVDSANSRSLGRLPTSRANNAAGLPN